MKTIEYLMLTMLLFFNYNIRTEDLNGQELEIVKLNELLNTKRNAFTKAVANKFGDCLPGPTGATGTTGRPGKPGKSIKGATGPTGATGLLNLTCNSLNLTGGTGTIDTISLLTSIMGTGGLNIASLPNPTKNALKYLRNSNAANIIVKTNNVIPDSFTLNTSAQLLFCNNQWTDIVGNLLFAVYFQEQNITVTDNIGNASFGYSTSLSSDGNTLAIGGYQDNTNQGATWVFIRSGTTWTEQQKITVTDNIGAAGFGYSTSLSSDGNTLAVGGYLDNSGQGATWVFTRSGTTWTEQQKITVTDNIGNAELGFSVSLSSDGNTLASGGINDNSGQGATWIFTRSGTTWTEQQKITVTDNIGNASFGYSTSLSSDGNTLAVGGYIDNSSQGATWVFIRSGTTWTEQQKITVTDNIGNANFGYSTSLSSDGNTLAVGGYVDNSGQGATWIFTRSGTTWTEQQKITVTDNIGNALFGASVSLSSNGNTLAIGGNQDNNGIGATWIFTRSGSSWTQQASKLVGTGNIGTSNQGWSVSLSSDANTLAIGGPQNNSGIGATWVFVAIE